MSYHRRVRGLLIVAVIALAACKSSDKPATEHTNTVAGARVVELRSTHLDPALPLVIGLHGKGGSPERFAHNFDGADLANDVILIAGFVVHEDRAAWFEWPPNTSDDQLADLVAVTEARLWPVIAELAHGRKVIVTGFSQGAVMTYALAAKHPDQIAFAFPIAGRLPAKLAPTARGAPIYALHGVDDPVVEIEYGRSAIAGFSAAGGPAQIHEFPGTVHTVSDEMRAELIERIKAVK
jgi:predicted esterase